MTGAPDDGQEPPFYHRTRHPNRTPEKLRKTWSRTVAAEAAIEEEARRKAENIRRNKHGHQSTSEPFP